MLKATLVALMAIVLAIGSTSSFAQQAPAEVTAPATVEVSETAVVTEAFTATIADKWEVNVGGTIAHMWKHKGQLPDKMILKKGDTCIIAANTTVMVTGSKGNEVHLRVVDQMSGEGRCPLSTRFIVSKETYAPWRAETVARRQSANRSEA